MEKYEILPTEEGVLLTCDEFDIQRTFDCGQCFRFEKESETTVVGVVFGKVVRLRNTPLGVLFEGIGEKEFIKKWVPYLCLDMNYSGIRKIISTDEYVKNAMEYGRGIRVLDQDFFECSLSFLCSMNNNIPRIKKIIQAFCENFGKEIEFEGKKYHAFPTLDDLEGVTKEDLQCIRCGYRDGYIIDALRFFREENHEKEVLEKMDTKHLRELLMSINGVGPKVADCIMLFSLKKYEACPHDTWVKQIFEKRYKMEKVTNKKGNAFAEKKWGAYAGIAQQYMFFYEREYMSKLKEETVSV